MRRGFESALFCAVLAGASGVRAEVRVEPCDEYDMELLEGALALELSEEPRTIRVELIPCAPSPLRVRVVLDEGGTETIVLEDSQPRFIALAVAERVRRIATTDTELAGAPVPDTPWEDPRRRITDAERDAWYHPDTLRPFRRGITLVSGNVAGGYGTGAMARGTLALEHRAEGPWTFAAHGRIWHFSREPSLRDDRYRFTRIRGSARYDTDRLTLGLQGGAVLVRGPQWRSLQPLVGLRIGTGVADRLRVALDVELRLPFGGSFGLSKVSLDLELRVTPEIALVNHVYLGAPARFGMTIGARIFLRGHGGPGTLALLLQLAPQLILIRRRCEFGPCGAIEGEPEHAFFGTLGANVGLEIRL